MPLTPIMWCAHNTPYSVALKRSTAETQNELMFGTMQWVGSEVECWDNI